MGTLEQVKNLISWHHREVVIDGKAPHIPNSAYVAPSATLAGRVEVWDYATVAANAVVRGDVRLVRIGAYSNVGEGSVVTEAFGPLSDNHDGSTIIGHYVSIGPRCSIHAATVEPECRIGAGCTLAAGSYMETHSELAAGSQLPANARVPSGELWGGNPAQKIRDLSADEQAALREAAEQVHQQAEKHKAQVEATPYNMDAVWEAEKMGLGKAIGYQ